MELDRTNYEVWFIDYLEGKLDGESMKELRAFLLLNPDLAEELEILERASQSNSLSIAPPLEFPDKLNLKKSEVLQNASLLDELLAKEAEGQLTPEERIQLAQLSSHDPNFKIEREAMKRARLTAAPVRFEYKEKIHFPEFIDHADDEMKLIALIEGDLDSKEAIELHNRISNEPALSNSYRILSLTRLTGDNLNSGLNESLRFPESVDYSDDRMLIAAYVDGALDEKQSREVSQKIASDSQLTLDFELMKSAVLPAEKIIFPEKNSLYRKETAVITFTQFIRYASAAAAIIALIVWINYSRSGAEAEMAHNPSQPANENPIVQPEQRPVTNVNGQETEQKINPSVHAPSEKSLAAQKEIRISPLSTHSEEPELAHRLEIPGKLESIEGGLLPDDPEYSELAVIVPDMKEIHHPVYHAQEVRENESVSLFEMLGRAAAEKIENTYAYSLAERQISRISEKTKSGIEINTPAGHASEKIRTRFGPFAVERVKKKSEEVRRPGLIGKLERIYDKVSGQE